MMNNFSRPGYLILGTIVSFSSSIAQVTTRFLGSDNSNRVGVLQANVSIPLFQSPGLSSDELKTLLREDSVDRLAGKPFRFGKAFEVDIDFLDDAYKVSNGDSTVSVYQFGSSGATSINLIFDRFRLGKNSSMIIYDADLTMIYGPVDSSNNPRNGVFWTDLIKGDRIIVQLNTSGPNEDSETVLHLSSLIHGYQNAFAGYGESAMCNRDMACPEGNAWTNQGNAVAMLLLANGTRFCSGVLLNTACQDYVPTFLTAFHCLDTNINGALEPAESNAVNNWLFRFLYESDACGGPDDSNYVTINGSNLRASWQPSDYALLQLNATSSQMYFAGWSRSNVAATSAASIHHPNGDVKKISIDNNPVANVPVQTVWARDAFGNPTIVCPANTHWQSVFDSGTVQPGSSGAPLFDQNQRVVGQLHGDYLNTDNDYCAHPRGQYGRLDVSWAHGLDVLLTNDPNVQTANTAGMPFTSISGTNFVVCSNPSIGLSVINAPSSVTHAIVWSIPSNLTVVSSGYSSKLVKYSGSGNGPAVVTATIRNKNLIYCNNSLQLTWNLQAGPFQTSQITVSGQAGVCPGYSYTYTANVPQGGSYTYAWTYPTGWSVFSQYQNTITLYVPQYNPQYGTVRVSVNNGCGASSYTGLTVYPGYSCGGYGFVYYPNPLQDQLIVEAVSESDGAKLNNGATVAFDAYILDERESELRRGSSNQNKIILEVGDLKKGFYYLDIIDNRQRVRKRIVAD